MKKSEKPVSLQILILYNGIVMMHVHVYASTDQYVWMVYRGSDKTRNGTEWNQLGRVPGFLDSLLSANIYMHVCLRARVSAPKTINN